MNNMTTGRHRHLRGKVVSIASAPAYRSAMERLPGDPPPTIWPKDSWIESGAANSLEMERHAPELMPEFEIDMFKTKNIQCALVGGASPLLKPTFAVVAVCDDGPQMAS
jgi:hypothetical protein